jgi:hypothetical protein
MQKTPFGNKRMTSWDIEGFVTSIIEWIVSRKAENVSSPELTSL